MHNYCTISYYAIKQQNLTFVGLETELTAIVQELPEKRRGSADNQAKVKGSTTATSSKIIQKKGERQKDIGFTL